MSASIKAIEQKKRIFKTFGGILLGIFIIAELYPILWLMLSAFKSPNEFYTASAFALPKGFYTQNFIDAWTKGRMNIYFTNSIIATFVALFITIVVAAPASFAIAKMKWKYSKKTLSYFLLGIMVPVSVALTPLFIMYKQAGLLNSLWSLIITYSAFGLPMAIYIFTTNFYAIPDDLIEAAVVDGCSIYEVFYKIMLPLMKNTILTVVTLQFLLSWNDLIFSMTFNSKIELKTIQTGLVMFTGQYGQMEWGPIFASIAMGTLPTIVLYLGLNKMVMQGMTAGAVKG